MQPGSHRLNSNAAADRKRDAALRDIFRARRLAEQRAERSHPTERADATAAQRESATQESHNATEQMKVAAILAATSRRDDRCGPPRWNPFRPHSLNSALQPNAANEPRANGLAVCESGDRRERTRFAC